MINSKSTLLLELSLDEVLILRRLRGINYGQLIVKKQEGRITHFEVTNSEILEPRNWTEIAKGGE